MYHRLYCKFSEHGYCGVVIQCNLSDVVNRRYYPTLILLDPRFDVFAVVVVFVVAAVGILERSNSK